MFSQLQSGKKQLFSESFLIVPKIKSPYFNIQVNQIKSHSMPFKFEKLDVWKKALDLTLVVHKTTREFPKEEVYILASQIKRAADSISLNIAEGSTGQSDAEYARFVGIAMRSNIEVVGCIFIAQKREIINSNDFEDIYQRCEEIHRMLVGLRSRLKT
jgi:four helix bundle protein